MTDTAVIMKNNVLCLRDCVTIVLVSRLCYLKGFEAGASGSETDARICGAIAVSV